MPLNQFKKLLLSSFIIYAVLISTHKGEFWPFSIFPMFSQAGNPWSRAIVEKIEDLENPGLWEIKSAEKITFPILALDKYEVNAIDFGSYISETKNWDHQRIQGVRNVVQIKKYPGEKWMITSVKGHLTENDSVVVEFIPLLLVTADTTLKNPSLFK